MISTLPLLISVCLESLDQFSLVCMLSSRVECFGVRWKIIENLRGLIHQIGQYKTQTDEEKTLVTYQYSIN